MKNLLLTAAAAGAVMSVAGVANAQTWTTGYFGGSYSTINTGDTKAKTDDATIIAGRAVGSVQLDKGLEAQLDGDIASVDIGQSNSSNVTIWGPTIHIFKESAKGSKVGAILGYEDIEDNSIIAYGLEGRAAASDNVTVGASAIWGSVNSASPSSYNHDVRSYRGQVSFFASDDLRLDASVNSFRVSGSSPTSKGKKVLTTGTPNEKEEILAYQIGGEFALAMAPVSLTFSYERVQPGGTTSYDAFSVGARHSFGGTLKDRDRTSSPFDSIREILGGVGGAVESAVASCTYTSGCLSNSSSNSSSSSSTSH